MLAALSFLTIVGGHHPPTVRARWWFAPVGAALGGALAVVWLASRTVLEPGPAAAVVVAANALLTGMLHLDGLADSADGLLAPLTRDRRLEVMADPRSGAFATVGVVLVVLSTWSALATDRVEPLALVGVLAASRGLVAVVPAFVPYARAGGLAEPFLGAHGSVLGAHGSVLGARGMGPIVWLAPSLVVCAIAAGCRGAMAGGAGIVAGLAVVVLAHRRLGGFTGDVLGAAIVVAEAVALVALSAST